jgi:hypothetical protein
MKKSIFILILMIPLYAGAQGLRFSVVAEPQFSWMVPDVKSISSKGSVLGLNAGIGMDYYFSENYAFSTGITIYNTGGKLQYEDSMNFTVNSGIVTVPAAKTITYNLQYIDIPLGLKFKTTEIGYMTYFANLGVAPMIKVRARASDVSGVINKDNITEDINLMNMGYFINAGMQYSIGGSSAIILGVGYSSGFTDVTIIESDKISINTFTVKLGILF